MKYHARRQSLQRELRGGAESLQEITGRAERKLAEAKRTLQAQVRALAQAEMDVPAV